MLLDSNNATARVCQRNVFVLPFCFSEDITNKPSTLKQIIKKTIPMPVQSVTLTNFWPLRLFLASPMLLPSDSHADRLRRYHTMKGVNQDQLNANRQYKSAGRVNDWRSGSLIPGSNHNRHFYLCFYKILQYNKCDRSRAIVWVICSVIFCLVIGE